MKKELKEQKESKGTVIEINDKFRLVICRRDMYLEEFTDVYNPIEKTTSEKWKRCSGYCTRISHLFETYVQDKIIDSKGNIKNLVDAEKNLMDSIEKLPNLLLNGDERVVLITEKTTVTRVLDKKGTVMDIYREVEESVKNRDFKLPESSKTKEKKESSVKVQEEKNKESKTKEEPKFNFKKEKEEKKKKLSIEKESFIDPKELF